MDNLKKSRKSVRSSATRLEKRINDEVKGKPVESLDKQQLKWLLDEVVKLETELESLDKQIYQGLIDDPDTEQDDLDKEYGDNALYREKLGVVKNAIQEALNGSAFDLLSRLKSKRSEVRNVTDEICDRAKAELQKKDEVNMAQLQLYSKMLHSQEQSEESLNGEIMDSMLDLGSTPEERKEERNECLNRQIMRGEFINILHDMISPKPSSPVPSSSARASSSGQVHTVKVPKLKLETFDGTLENWLTFWACFEEIHDDVDMTENSKLRYLYNSMIPETRPWKMVKKYFHVTNGYEEAIKALKDTFGDPQLLTQVYVKNLSNLIIKRSQKSVSLSDMFDELEAQLKGLAKLGVKEETLAFLFPFVESVIPEEIQKAWQRSDLSGYRDKEKVLSPEQQLENLMTFLRDEVKTDHRMSLSKAEEKKDQKTPPKPQSSFKKPENVNYKKNVGENKRRYEDVPTAAGFTVSQNKKSKYPCVFCEIPNHDSQDCRKAVDMTREERESKCDGKNACFRCLIPGHMGKNCKKILKCAICKGKHYPIMCYSADKMRESRPGSSNQNRNQSRNTSGESKSANKGENKRREERPRSRDRSRSRSKDKGGERQSHAVTTRFANFSTKDLVLLKTVLVKACGPDGERCVRLLIDEGSQVSYVGKKTADSIGAVTKETERVQNVLLGGITTDFHDEDIKEIVLKSIDENESKTWFLREKPLVCTKLPRVPQGNWIEDLAKEDIIISDVTGAAVEDDNVEILIGSDYRAEIMTGRKLDLGNNLIAEESIFGWTLSGPVPNQRLSVANMLVSFCLEGLQLQDLWSLEALGIKDPIEKQTKEEEASQAYRHFLRNLRRHDDGRYSVGLPWIDEKPNLPTNWGISYRRLTSTTAKLKSNNMLDTYDSLFKSWKEESFVEEVEGDAGDSSRHYLPHHAVIKPTSLTTPVRPVFDASAKVRGGLSLNDCLYTGPNLIELIPEVLMRFREKSVGVFSDVRKAFQMIDINEDDRDVLSFLWWKDQSCSQLKVLRHKRVVFGVKSSPFLLGAVLKYHLEGVNDVRREKALKLLRSMYVDNSICSVDSREEYLAFRQTAT